MTNDVNKLGVDTVTIVRAPLVRSSRDNSLVRDWSNAVSTEYHYNKVEPFPTTKNRLFIEVDIDREFSANYFRLWLVPECDVVSTDRITWRSHKMDIQGIPGEWTDFEGTVHYIGVLAYERQG